MKNFIHAKGFEHVGTHENLLVSGFIFGITRIDILKRFGCEKMVPGLAILRF
jgi:hypothetical protein